MDTSRDRHSQEYKTKCCSQTPPDTVRLGWTIREIHGPGEKKWLSKLEANETQARKYAVHKGSFV